MRLDTPLAEVARMLPTEAAQLLSPLDPMISEAVLSYTRSIIVLWEQSGVDLDPITFSRVLTPVVEALTHTVVVTIQVAAKLKEQS